MAERLSQTELLVTQLKEMIREKDASLRSKDDQLKVEKEACESKLSKLRLQSKAKVTSLNAQLEELKKQHGGQGTPTHGKKASRGKIVLLRKKVEELEHQLAKRQEELEKKSKEVEFQRQRGEEIDMMLTEKDRKLAEKEAYIVHLQSALSGDQPITPAPQQQPHQEGGGGGGALQSPSGAERQLQRAAGLRERAIQTFKDIIIQKDNLLTEINQIHEQELFKLAAKSDASADIEQALKQKLYEKEEVLLGKTQVIDVLQQEVDGRDQQIKELTERLRRLHVERESLESKMEAEKHVMRAQLRDLMEKQQAEVQRVKEELQEQMEQKQQEIRRSAAPPTHREEEETGSDSASNQRIAELEGRAKKKTDEASRSEAKFLKMKAWSKTRIRQLEEELKKSQAGGAPPDLNALARITALEEEREENLWKVEQYEELKAKNGPYRPTWSSSPRGRPLSADDTQSHVLEWQEMVSDAVSARDRAKEEKAAMVLRISHMEEEREALASRQQELEEELTQARGLGHHRSKKLSTPAQRSLQEDFEFDGQTPFQDPRSPSESTTEMEGENMGDGLRSVVEELELERNQLQEQILIGETSEPAVQRPELSNTQECLESSLIEKENTLAKTSEKLELINGLRESLREKETQYKDVSDKLLQTELTLENVSQKCSVSEKQCSQLKSEVIDVTQKLSLLKEKAQKQEVTIETLQTELDQTNEELDKLNSAHLEERAQLIHDLQSCEREIDRLKDVVLEKDEEISTLSGNMAEYAEQVTMMKQDIKLKEETLVRGNCSE
ncbi:hypothetical protein F7725_025945 [Dissostichus mawsoni]|uniref:Uncharacterized protein n=1 Tax=Dissostichus mawsoni TaxID=36200 RepID=A0A7J5X5M9_DISMA|nr:hypothetical protein F7725_025945 [Dissostichus mawsoni]